VFVRAIDTDGRNTARSQFPEAATAEATRMACTGLAYTKLLAEIECRRE